MRYLVTARVRPGRRGALARAIDDGTLGAGSIAGDEYFRNMAEARALDDGCVQWVEVCYCREYYGVAMEEELPYFQEFLTDIVVADARSPRLCNGYPACSDCDCTWKVRPKGEPFLDYLRRSVAEPEAGAAPAQNRPPRWLGWRGQVTPEEDRRNRAGRAEAE